MTDHEFVAEANAVAEAIREALASPDPRSNFEVLTERADRFSRRLEEREAAGMVNDLVEQQATYVVSTKMDELITLLSDDEATVDRLNARPPVEPLVRQWVDRLQSRADRHAAEAEAARARHDELVADMAVLHEERDLLDEMLRVSGLITDAEKETDPEAMVTAANTVAPAVYALTRRIQTWQTEHPERFETPERIGMFTAFLEGLARWSEQLRQNGVVPRGGVMPWEAKPSIQNIVKELVADVRFTTPDNSRAKNLPTIRDTLLADWKSGQYRQTATFPDWEIGMLTAARLMWVAPEFVSLVGTVAETVPVDTPFTESSMIWPSGFAVFATPLPGDGVDGGSVSVHALGWHPIRVLIGGTTQTGVGITAYEMVRLEDGLTPDQLDVTGPVIGAEIDGRCIVGPGGSLNLHGALWVPLGRSDWLSNETVGTVAGATSRGFIESVVQDRQWLIALWKLMGALPRGRGSAGFREAGPVFRESGRCHRPQLEFGGWANPEPKPCGECGAPRVAIMKPLHASQSSLPIAYAVERYECTVDPRHVTLAGPS